MKYFILSIALWSASAFAHEEYRAGICFLSSDIESVDIPRYDNSAEHVDYQLSVDSELVRSVDVSITCEQPNTTCRIDSAKAKQTLAKLNAMAAQLKADGVCKSVINNID